MAEIKNVNGRYVIDYMARDFDSLLRSMRELIPAKLPEWKEFESEADFGNVLLQLFAHMGDILSYYQDRIANESFLSTAQTRRSIIDHLRLIGYKLSTAVPASTKVKLTCTVPDDFTEVITINRGDAFATKSQKNRPSVRFEYNSETPLTIDTSSITPVDGKKSFERIIPVEEGRLVENEILGRSDGTPNQRFSLAHRGMILRSLGQGQTINKDIVLTTDLGGTIAEWRLQDTLAFSRNTPDDKDFVIEIDEEDRATVIFGDGIFGFIPPRDAVIKASYRVGGGRHGNMAANTIETIVNAPQLARWGAEITNDEPATGGADRESIEHAVQHAPDVFRSLKRAVTAEDYKALALDFKGVGKVRAEAGSWNVIKLFVAPEGGGHVSDVLRQNLLAYFDDKRPLTTLIDVEDVDYVKIYVAADVGVKSYYSTAAVAEQVKNAAGSLLAFENVDFAQPIYLSKFYEKIEAIAGVAFVNITEFRRQEQAAGSVQPEGKIIMSANEIPRIPDDPTDDPMYAGGIKLTTQGGN